MIAELVSRTRGERGAALASAESKVNLKSIKTHSCYSRSESSACYPIRLSEPLLPRLLYTLFVFKFLSFSTVFEKNITTHTPSPVVVPLVSSTVCTRQSAVLQLTVDLVHFAFEPFARRRRPASMRLAYTLKRD